MSDAKQEICVELPFKSLAYPGINEIEITFDVELCYSPADPSVGIMGSSWDLQDYTITRVYMRECRHLPPDFMKWKTVQDIEIDPKEIDIEQLFPYDDWEHIEDHIEESAAERQYEEENDY